MQPPVGVSLTCVAVQACFLERLRDCLSPIVCAYLVVHAHWWNVVLDLGLCCTIVVTGMVCAAVASVQAPTCGMSVGVRITMREVTHA